MPKFKNSLTIPKYLSVPPSANDGDLYYNTGSNAAFARMAGTWVETTNRGMTRVVTSFPVGQTTNWTRPSGVNFITITLAGGAGGGGAGGHARVHNNVANAAGGGGGGGSTYGYIKNFYIDPGSGNSFSVAVGAGGSGGTGITSTVIPTSGSSSLATTGSGGQSGGDTRFYLGYNGSGSANALLSATGGGGGGGGAASINNLSTTGGSAGGAGELSYSYPQFGQLATLGGTPWAGVIGGATGSNSVSSPAPAASSGNAGRYYLPFYGKADANNYLTSSGSFSNNGTTNPGGFVTTTISGSVTSGSVGGGSGGASASADSSVGVQTLNAPINGAAYGGGAVAVYDNGSKTCNLTLIASNGANGSGLGCGGGGGGAVAFGCGNDATINYSGLSMTSGSGGNGTDGFFIIEYFI